MRAALALTLALVLAACARGSAPPSPNSVVIANFSFQPAQIAISPGQTVVWTNRDSVSHTVTGEGFDSGSIAPGGTYRQRFSQAGEFAYACSVHPSMRGTVRVR